MIAAAHRSDKAVFSRLSATAAPSHVVYGVVVCSARLPARFNGLTNRQLMQTVRTESGSDGGFVRKTVITP